MLSNRVTSGPCRTDDKDFAVGLNDDVGGRFVSDTGTHGLAPDPVCRIQTAARSVADDDHVAVPVCQHGRVTSGDDSTVRQDGNPIEVIP